MYVLRNAVVTQLVECHLAKVDVASSNLVYRSIWRYSQAVRHGPAKPPSPVRFRVAPPKEKALLLQCFFFWNDAFRKRNVMHTACVMQASPVMHTFGA